MLPVIIAASSKSIREVGNAIIQVECCRGEEPISGRGQDIRQPYKEVIREK
jgi:hypothetical protein